MLKRTLLDVIVWNQSRGYPQRLYMINEAYHIGVPSTPRNNLATDGATKRLDISTMQALAAQAPAVVSLRRQLEERLVRYLPIDEILKIHMFLSSWGVKLTMRLNMNWS